MATTGILLSFKYSYNSRANNKLQIAFYDMGSPVDPKKVKHREIDNVKPGGLGTFFIQEIMDAVEFKGGKKPWINHLVLTKQL